MSIGLHHVGILLLPSQSGDTPLIVASDKGHSSVVRVLLQGGANINTTTEVRYYFNPVFEILCIRSFV